MSDVKVIHIAFNIREEYERDPRAFAVAFAQLFAASMTMLMHCDVEASAACAAEHSFCRAVVGLRDAVKPFVDASKKAIGSASDGTVH
jgi:hypothetical protein